MNIDLMSVKRDMDYIVNNIEPFGGDFEQRYTGGTILSSISFSDMLENAIRAELMKDSLAG